LTWTEDKRYSDKDREKLSKGSGFVKFWTLISNWLWKAINW